MSKLKRVFLQRAVREELMDRVELAMAFIVVAGYVYSKVRPEPKDLDDPKDVEETNEK